MKGKDEAEVSPGEGEGRVMGRGTMGIVLSH